MMILVEDGIVFVGQSIQQGTVKRNLLGAARIDVMQAVVEGNWV